VNEFQTNSREVEVLWASTPGAKTILVSDELS